MDNFFINRQTEAEKDDFLLDCFHDAGFITSLIQSRSSIISGRKGVGKTALARFLEKKSKVFGIDLAFRISIRNLSLNNDESKTSRLHTIAFYIIVKTVQRLLSESLFSAESRKYWEDFLLQNGLQYISDYETFVESRKTNKTGFSIKGFLSSIFARVDGSVETQNDTELSRAFISDSPSSLIESLKQSLPENKTIYIFIDDISDHLDDTDDKRLDDDISLIKDFLLNFENYNSVLTDAGKKLRFISLLRDDLFEFMGGSNINKLRSDALQLEWNEKSFAGLLIRRLPFYQDNLIESLKDPIEALRSQFSDDIFAGTLENFNTNRYKTNFYAYMVAISFNRPRDFLMFCYAMRDRLSLKNPVTFENIESAEIEYSDYFRNELRDELFLVSRKLQFDIDDDSLNQLIDILSQKDGFNSSQLRSDLIHYLDKKTGYGKKKVEYFISELWWYGILGFEEEKKGLINFRYLSKNTPLIMAKVKNYIYFLHRGLWWFVKKNKSRLDKSK